MFCTIIICWANLHLIRLYVEFNGEVASLIRIIIIIISRQLAKGRRRGAVVVRETIMCGGGTTSAPHESWVINPEKE